MSQCVFSRRFSPGSLSCLHRRAEPYRRPLRARPPQSTQPAATRPLSLKRHGTILTGSWLHRTISFAQLSVSLHVKPVRLVGTIALTWHLVIPPDFGNSMGRAVAPVPCLS